MKRVTLLVFILIAIVVVPGGKLRAQQEQQERLSLEQLLIPQHVALARSRLMDPHASLYQEKARSAELSELTDKIAASLPPAARAAGKLAPAAGDNVIDREIFGTLSARNVRPAQPATDEEMCRRLFLDITGRQPSPERLLKYIADPDPAKKSKLIDELLKSEAYIDRWANWFGDLTRNFGILGAYADRNAQHDFLREAVAKNTSYKQVATQLITYRGDIRTGPGGFLIRPILGSELLQDRYDEVTAEITRTFLGVQSVCVSCHDGAGHLEKINLHLSGKKRQEFWGLSAFVAQTRFSLTISDSKKLQYIANTETGARPPRTGGVIDPTYALFGSGAPAKGENRRVALARFITSDIQFSRAFVNRVFAHFFGIGLVEQLNGFDLARLDPNNPPPEPWQLQASHPVLLNEMALFFQQNNYDLKALIKLIAESDAYALSSRYPAAEWRPEYTRLFARKLVRRLQAEEVFDALVAASGMPASYSVRNLNRQFSSTMALPGPEEPSVSTGSSDPFFLVRAFLDDFGRGDRFLQPRNNNSSIVQALDLFNSDLVNKRIDNDRALANQLFQSVQQGKTTPTDALTQLFLMTIARRPTATEVAQLKDRFTTSREAVADLQWALVNRPEFLYNY